MTNEKKKRTEVSRRQFVGTVATAAGFTIVPRHVLGAGFQAPSDTVNVAVVGYVHGMGTSNLTNVAKSDNIVALCDCDDGVPVFVGHRGLERALVHGGFSSVLALEPPADHDGWPLTLSDPGAPSRVIARLSVRQTALSASGVRKGDHIVDTRAGGPARGRRAGLPVALPRPQRAAGPGQSGADGPRIRPRPSPTL